MPEDDEEYRVQFEAAAVRCAVDHFGEQLRSWRKHGHSFQTADDVIEFMITSFVEELP